MRLVTVLNTVLNIQNYALLAAVFALSAVLWQANMVTIGSIAVAIALSCACRA